MRAAPVEHLYTSNVQPYFRAPHLSVAFPARFQLGRQVVTAEECRRLGLTPDYVEDCSDAVFMTSRGGLDFDRTFPESFIRPGIGPNNWITRTNYPATGLVPTGPYEMSLYLMQDNAQATAAPAPLFAAPGRLRLRARPLRGRGDGHQAADLRGDAAGAQLHPPRPPEAFASSCRTPRAGPFRATLWASRAS